MKLEIVSLWSKPLFDQTITVEPSTVKRKWMSETNNEYAYRCLPLNIANQHGWAIYLNKKVTAVWNGELSLERDSIKILDNAENLAVSWFGYGVLTFSMPFLVRLDPEYSLYISGAPNHFVKGIQPCTGVFEADWAPYSFTMNWKFTHPYEVVTFNPTDPICFFFPVPRNIITETTTVMSSLAEQDQHYRDMYSQFTNRRGSFLEGQTNGEEWEKQYFKGLYPDGSKCPFDHKTKIKAKPFTS